MKPFNLEKALAGEKCVTRGGCEAYVKYREDRLGEYPLRGYYVKNDGEAEPCSWTLYGNVFGYGRGYHPTPLDIFMPFNKRTVWMNVYPNGRAYYYASEEVADLWAGIARVGGCAYPIEIEE